MKKIRSVGLVSIIVVLFIFSAVSAFDSNTFSATSFWSDASPSPGEIVTVTVNLESSSETLYLYRVGFHGDWMETGHFATLNYQNDPETVASGGIHVAEFPILIPTTATIGSHNYFIAVDGFDSSGESFSWDSPYSSIQITTASSTSTPTPTTSPGGEQTGDLSALLPYLIIIVVLVVVAILIILIIMQKKRKTTTSVSKYSENQTQSTDPKQPEQEDSSPPEQDFTI